MKLNALLIDLSILGPTGWEFLERVSGMLPDLGGGRLHQGSTVAQRVRGLRSGADDWIVEALAPRGGDGADRSGRAPSAPEPASAEAGPVVAGEIEIRADQFQAFVGRSLDLTGASSSSRSCWPSRAGRVLEREEIYQRVWGYAMAHGDRSVGVFVRKLRQKLEQASPGWYYIHTHFGVGYRFEPQAATPEDAEVPGRTMVTDDGPSGRRSGAAADRPTSAEPGLSEPRHRSEARRNGRRPLSRAAPSTLFITDHGSAPNSP